MTATLYIDSSNYGLFTSDPRGENDDRSITELVAPEGSNVLELLPTLDGWMKSTVAMKRLGIQPGTIVKITIG